MVAWIIMAPEMLANASRSRPCRTQITAFMVSGSSVAIGLSSSATNCGAQPRPVAIVSNRPTKKCEATPMTAKAIRVCSAAQVSDGEESCGRIFNGSNSCSAVAGSSFRISRQR